MKKKQINKKYGFTLIEIIVVLGIIVILAAMTLGSMLNSQYQQVFNNNFQNILNAIKESRSLAISSKGQLDYTDADKDGKIDTDNDYATPANYGVYFDLGAKKVIVFSDVTPPSSNPVGAIGRYDAGTNYAGGQDIALRTYTMPSNFDITLSPLPGGNKGSIFFSPLYADMKFENIALVSTPPILEIKLQETDGQHRCRKIDIHQLSGIPEVKLCP